MQRYIPFSVRMAIVIFTVTLTTAVRVDADPAAGTSPAPAGQTTPSGSVVPSSGDAVKAGDIIIFRSEANILQRLNTDPVDKTIYCAPTNTRFLVSTITPGTSNSAADNGAGASPKATPADTQIIKGVLPSKGPGLFHRRQKLGAANATNIAASPACIKAIVDSDIPYQFTAGDLANVYTQRMGFTWGAMVIPYKFYFTDKSFKSNPSTVAFVGYEGYAPGVSLAGVLALGPGLTSNSQSTNTSSGTTGGNGTSNSTQTTTSGNSVTYTAATGFIVTFGGSIKAGILFGRDWEGSGSGFKYENKTWMALSVGTSF